MAHLIASLLRLLSPQAPQLPQHQQQQQQRVSITPPADVENISALANELPSSGLGAADARFDAAIKSEAQTTVKPEASANINVDDMAENANSMLGALHDALKANKDNALMMTAAAAAASQAVVATNAYLKRPDRFVAAARHMSEQAAKIGAAVSDLRIVKPKAAGGENKILCKACRCYHAGPTKTCTDCTAHRRVKIGTSLTKCGEQHFPTVEDAVQYAKTQLDDSNFAHYVIDHTGDKHNHGKSVAETNTRLRLVCHCHYKPSKELEAQIQAQRSRTLRILLHSVSRPRVYSDNFQLLCALRPHRAGRCSGTSCRRGCTRRQASTGTRRHYAPAEPVSRLPARN